MPGDAPRARLDAAQRDRSQPMYRAAALLRVVRAMVLERGRIHHGLLCACGPAAGGSAGTVTAPAGGWAGTMTAPAVAGP